jgi:integrase
LPGFLASPSISIASPPRQQLQRRKPALPLLAAICERGLGRQNTQLGDDAITIATGKSRQHREAIIPLYDALRNVLASIPKQSTTVLTNSRRRPWTADGFGSSFNKAKIDAGLADADLHFHDLRGTAATRFYTAGLSERVIAEIMGWEEEHVSRIIRRYVGRSAATKVVIRQLNKPKTGRKSPYRHQWVTAGLQNRNWP